MSAVLHDLEERPDSEVALLLGIPRNTVKSRLRRGRRALRDPLIRDTIAGWWGSGVLDAEGGERFDLETSRIIRAGREIVVLPRRVNEAGDDPEVTAEVVSRVQAELRHHFKPEFLNRIDDILLRQELIEGQAALARERARLK